jgi:hypothetical protein
MKSCLLNCALPLASSHTVVLQWSCSSQSKGAPAPNNSFRKELLLCLKANHSAASAKNWIHNVIIAPVVQCIWKLGLRYVADTNILLLQSFVFALHGEDNLLSFMRRAPPLQTSRFLRFKIIHRKVIENLWSVSTCSSPQLVKLSNH